MRLHLDDFRHKMRNPVKNVASKRRKKTIKYRSGVFQTGAEQQILAPQLQKLKPVFPTIDGLLLWLWVHLVCVCPVQHWGLDGSWIVSAEDGLVGSNADSQYEGHGIESQRGQKVQHWNVCACVCGSKPNKQTNQKSKQPKLALRFVGRISAFQLPSISTSEHFNFRAFQLPSIWNFLQQRSTGSSKQVRRRRS